MENTEDKKKHIKPANENPAKEAIGHPNGPGLLEMLGGQEDKKLKPGTNFKKTPGEPDIPVI